MADVDWIKARAACCFEVSFRQLQVAVKRDVESMNAVLVEANRPVSCEFGNTGNRFLVTISGKGFPVRSAEFTLTSSAISIEVDKPIAKKLTAIPSLNPDGECKLVVGGQELELWQVCRM